MSKLCNSITVKYVPHKLSRVFLGLIILIVAISIGIGITNLLPSQVILLTIGLLFFLLILAKPYIGPLITVALVFLPISAGNFFGHPLYITYFVIPLVTIVYFLSRATKKKPILAFRCSLNPLLIPISLYFCVIIGTYLTNPISLTQIPELAKGLMGFKTWINYFLCFCIYFMFTEMATADTPNTRKAFTILWIITVVCSIAGVALVYSSSVQKVFSNLESRSVFMPMGWGIDLSAIQEGHILSTGGRFRRIGIFQSASPIALFLLLLRIVKPNSLLKWILYGFFGYTLILSGGRASFGGVTIALLMWVIIQKKLRLFILAIFLVILLYLGVFVYYDVLPSLLQRILMIKGSLSQIDIGIGATFPLYWESFLRNPLFGVGITLAEYFKEGFFSTSLFVYQQLSLGGHGTYLSILYLMGLAGFIPFVWGLVQGMKSSYFLSQKTKEKLDKSVALFCFLWLIFRLIPMGFGGRGGDLLYFMVLGIVSGLCIRWKRLDINPSPKLLVKGVV